MASNAQELHFLVIPLMSQSHLIPMTDFAKLLAQRDLRVTIITTPLNAIRFKGLIERAIRSNLKIQLIPLKFPSQEAGLPEGCENMDSLTSPNLVKKFFIASGLLQESLENLIQKLEPRPSCIISTNVLTWTSEIARKFEIPRFVFHANSCFSLLCSKKISSSNVLNRVNSDSELFLVPDMPHRIEFTKAQLPDVMRRDVDSSGLKTILDKMREAELLAHGVLVNTFEELESIYVEEYKKVVKNLWCIGPVSLCNKDISDKFDRGNKASIDENHCLKWLDSMNPSSVVYACFGSLCHISHLQLIEIGLGLESSNQPFIWVIRESNLLVETEKWLEEERFEERIKNRGLIIRGWAPQVLILSHRAIGGFLTHCGWNSTLECVCAGVPMITWPMFAEQFYNEKFVVDMLKIGVRIGVEVCMQWVEEENGKLVLVKREQIKEVIGHLMEGEDGGEIRKRAREVGEMAKRESEQGGSSYLNIELMIQSVMQSIQNKGVNRCGIIS